MARGTWQTTDSGGGKGLFIVLAVVLVLALTYHAVQAIPWWIWLALPVSVAVFCILAAVLVWRAHQREAARLALVRDRRELPIPPVPRPPPPLQVHHHWHGVSPAEMAEIMGRQDGERR